MSILTFRIIGRLALPLPFLLLLGVFVSLRTGLNLPAGEELAFVSRRAGDAEIYLLDLDRQITQNLTKTVYWPDTVFSSQDQAPVWSPDGTRLAFHANRTGSNDIFVMDASGRNVQRLTFHASIDINPSWSPDGKRLVYQSFRETDFELFVLDIDAALRGESPYRLTDNEGSDRHPSFSPDGTRIVYASDAGNVFGSFELYTMNADGTEPRRLHTMGPESNALHPKWSPDGQYILFDGFSDQSVNNVYLLRANGRGTAHRIAGDSRSPDAYLPAWTPDGSGVLFVSSRLGYSEIYHVPVLDEFEVGEMRQLTHNPTMDIYPALRPRDTFASPAELAVVPTDVPRFKP